MPGRLARDLIGLRILPGLLRKEEVTLRSIHRAARISRLTVRTSLPLLIAATIGTGLSPAWASPQPPIEKSYYIKTTNTTTLQNLGCGQAQRDNANGRASKVVLDFGGQNADGSFKLTNGTNIAGSTVANLAEWYTYGYGTCTNGVQWTQEGIGTNNSLSVSSSLGSSMATNVVAPAVAYANSWNTRVVVEAANDMEPGFHGASDTRAWVNGFMGTDPKDIITNYGSADGCPSSGSGGCNNGWSQGDIYYISWGCNSCYVAPEIYYNPPPGSPVNANQWKAINDTQGGGMQPDGPLDQWPLANNSNTAAQAWSELNPLFPNIGHSMEISNSN